MILNTLYTLSISIKGYIDDNLILILNIVPLFYAPSFLLHQTIHPHPHPRLIAYVSGQSSCLPE